MFFALAVMGYSFQNPLGKPTSTERILAQPFLICIYCLIRYVWPTDLALQLHLGANER